MLRERGVQMTRFALQSWFCSPRYAILAWLGVVESVVHVLLNVYVSSLQVAWEGRFYNLLAAARQQGIEMLPQLYSELWYISYILTYYIITDPLHGLFNSWYSLKCDQTIQRAYVAHWPSGRVPEGAGQRLHEDVGSAIKGNLRHGGLREAWQWSLVTVTKNISSLAVFFNQLVLLSYKFRAPPFMPNYTHWIPALAVVLPIFGTGISSIMTTSMRKYNYDIQRIDASIRKAFIRAEDIVGAPVVEHLLQDLAAVCLRLWTIGAAFGAWGFAYEEMPSMLLKVALVPQLFSTAADAPTLGDLRMVEASFMRVIANLSFFVFNMDTVNYYRSVLQRLHEFEVDAGYADKSSFQTRPKVKSGTQRRHFSAAPSFHPSVRAKSKSTTVLDVESGRVEGALTAAEAEQQRARRATCAVDMGTSSCLSLVDRESTPPGVTRLPESLCAIRTSASDSSSSSAHPSPPEQRGTRPGRIGLHISQAMLDRMRYRRRQLGIRKKDLV